MLCLLCLKGTCKRARDSVCDGTVSSACSDSCMHNMSPGSLQTLFSQDSVLRTPLSSGTEGGKEEGEGTGQQTVPIASGCHCVTESEQLHITFLVAKQTCSSSRTRKNCL